MTEPTRHTLDVPGAVLAYDVWPNDSSTEPVLLLIGSPMGASGFGTLAGYFTDRTVGSYDPRKMAQALPGKGLEGDRYVAGTGTFPSRQPGSALSVIEAEVREDLRTRPSA